MIEKIKKILDAHGVPYILEGGRIYADSMVCGTALFEAVEDVTDWTLAKLYSWLGY